MATTITTDVRTYTPPAITNGGYTNMKPSLYIQLIYTPGGSTMTLKLKKNSLSVTDGSVQGRGFVNGFMFTLPPGGSVYDGGYSDPVTDTTAKAIEDMKAWAGLNSKIWGCVQHDNSAAHEEFGDLADGAWHTYTIDISNVASGSYPTLLVEASRLRRSDSDGHAQVGLQKSYNAQKLGLPDIPVFVPPPRPTDNNPDQAVPGQAAYRRVGSKWVRCLNMQDVSGVSS